MNADLNLDEFADFLSKQPRDQTYDFWCKECAIGSFLTAKEIAFKSLGTALWVDAHGFEHKIPAHFNIVSATKPYTYGAAADRALALLNR